MTNQTTETREEALKNMLDNYSYYVMQWEHRLIDIKIIARFTDYPTALFYLRNLQIAHPLNDYRIVRELK